jgi:hypothetical protein
MAVRLLALREGSAIFISVRDSVNPRAIVRLKGLNNKTPWPESASELY